MNRWLQLSIDYANQHSYLDDLFRVYPTIPEGIRDINQEKWKQVELAFEKRDNLELISRLLKLDLFPIKDSYIAYLKRDKSAIDRNPNTINRICGRLYEMGLDRIYEKATEPKETNRQIGPMFMHWLRSKSLGIKPVGIEKFLEDEKNAILDASDGVKADFAEKHLNYSAPKGLDLVARFNKKLIIGEAKFITDFGGHQTAQFNDALNLLSSSADAIKVAILDGVIYIPGENKMHRTMISHQFENRNIMSALVLREYLYSL